MSERTDERTRDAGDVDVDLGGDLDAGDVDVGSDSGDVGFSDDELGVDVEALTGEPDASANRGSASGSASASSGSSLLSRLTPSLPSLPNPIAALPSLGSVVLTFIVVLVSMGVVTSVPVLSMVPLLWAVGIFAGAFGLGAVSGDGRYFELALAGGVSGSSLVVGDFFRIAVLSNVGLFPLMAAGAGIGVVAGLIGHYFGRDFRSGLTRDIE